MLINGIKFACNTCVKGHRSSNCNHIERPLFEIRKKGRPVTQCAFCRDLRKTRQIHIKCTCTDKSKNIENTATTCYQCPSITTSTTNSTTNMSASNSGKLAGGLVIEEQGTSYSDLIQNSLLNNSLSQDSDIQCTCHEAANKIILSQQQQPQEQFNSVWPQENITPILPVSRSRGMTIDEASPGYGNYSNQVQKSSSFRFLDGQTNSPRRKSSTSSSRSNSSSKRKSTSFQQAQQQQYHVDDTTMLDMQSLLFSQQQQQNITEIEKSERSSSMMIVNNNNTFPSNSSTTTSISSTSTPNSNYNSQNASNYGFNNYNNKEEQDNRNALYNNDINLMMNTTDPDELTSLLNNVLNDRRQQQKEPRENMLVEDSPNPSFNKHTLGSVDMARSTTNNSFSSSSSLNGNIAFIVPPPQQRQIVCGSFTPHSNCSPAIDSQGESVVITITPLSNLQKQQVIDENNSKSMTRIVTCYCGNSCICPGCFVHPNNYIHQQQSTMQQSFMQIKQQNLSSNNSSSYSSDDEEQHQHSHNNSSMNYATANYSLL